MSTTAKSRLVTSMRRSSGTVKVAQAGIGSPLEAPAFLVVDGGDCHSELALDQRFSDQVGKQELRQQGFEPRADEPFALRAPSSSSELDLAARSSTGSSARGPKL